MKKLLLFTSMLTSICTYNAQAQDTNDFIQEAINLTTIKEGAKKDSACFSFLGDETDQKGMRKSYVLKLLYNTPEKGPLTKDHLEALKMFPKGTSDLDGVGHASFFNDRTEEDREKTLERFLKAPKWVAYTDPNNILVVRLKDGCPNSKYRP